MMNFVHKAEICVAINIARMQKLNHFFSLSALNSSVETSALTISSSSSDKANPELIDVEPCPFANFRIRESSTSSPFSRKSKDSDSYMLI